VWRTQHSLHCRPSDVQAFSRQYSAPDAFVCKGENLMRNNERLRWYHHVLFTVGPTILAFSIIAMCDHSVGQAAFLAGTCGGGIGLIAALGGPSE
jgi:hypothetical protein